MGLGVVAPAMVMVKIGVRVRVGVRAMVGVRRGGTWPS